MVTPKFLALVFPVRIGAAQQGCNALIFHMVRHSGLERCEM